MSLNVVIITQGLSRIVNPIFSSSHNLVGIVEDAPRNYTRSLKNRFEGILQYLYFFIKKRKTLKKYSQDNKIPYFFFKKNEEEKLRDWLAGLNVDIIVVYGMSKLLKPIIFELPKYGTINLHPSYLPEYPGRNPWFWTYVNMDLNPGITLHYIDKGEDTGDIIYQERFDMALGMESPEMHDIAIGNHGNKMILKALDELSLTEKLPKKKQDKSKVYPKAYQIEIDTNIIDWSTWDVERVWHLLKGTQMWYNPIEQPKGIYKGQRWKVLNYNKSIVNTDNVGKVVRDGAFYCLITKNGQIFLKPSFSLTRLIKFLLKI